MNTEIFKNIFKAYDIRGKVGTELNASVAETVGRAFAEWLPQTGAVMVGRDMRPDSQELADALIKGITEQGYDVLDIGEVTSDMIYFGVGHFGAAGGVMVTASHNPGEYNGIKFCREEAKPIGEESGLFEIRDLAIRNIFKATKKIGSVSNKDITEDWVSHVLSFINTDKLKPLKIAVDAGNGMAGKIFPEIEPYLPFEIEELYFELDGTFPNHIANPLEEKNLKDIQRIIKEKKLDAGVAFDGDGDRAVLIDENGEALTGSVLTALLSEYFLKMQPGSVILFNAICGRVVPETIKQSGGTSKRTRVGHSFIKASMRQYGAIFAGEHSGHYYFKDNFMADSGLIAAIIGLYILSQSKQSLSTLAKPFRKAYVQIPETNFEVSNKEKVLNKLEETFKSTEHDNLDGLTVNYPYGWFNVRPSNTEPLLRFNAETKNEEQLKKLVNEVTQIIKMNA